VESATGTIRIRGRIPNPSLDANNTRLLFPGMYARVRVPKADESAQLVIPEDCLLNAQEGRFVYVIGADKKVQKRFVTLGATVWKAPPAVPGAAPPGWVAVNPNPAPPADGQPPANTRRPVRSVVAVAFHEPLRADERVTIDGIQRLKPGDPVDPEEWTLTPPADAPKK
jgi:multidrug efflux pump subunit AcrA (membrane-fusion protein)